MHRVACEPCDAMLSDANVTCRACVCLCVVLCSSPCCCAFHVCASVDLPAPGSPIRSNSVTCTCDGDGAHDITHEHVKWATTHVSPHHTMSHPIPPHRTVHAHRYRHDTRTSHLCAAIHTKHAMTRMQHMHAHLLEFSNPFSRSQQPAHHTQQQQQQQQQQQHTCTTHALLMCLHNTHTRHMPLLMCCTTRMHHDHVIPLQLSPSLRHTHTHTHTQHTQHIHTHNTHTHTHTHHIMQRHPSIGSQHEDDEDGTYTCQHAHTYGAMPCVA